MQVLWGYRREEPYGSLWRGHTENVVPVVLPDHPQAADPAAELYAASKVWGEGMAHVYTYSYGMSACAYASVG